MTVKETGAAGMHEHIKLVAYGHYMGGAWHDAVTPLTVSDIALPSVSHDGVTDLAHYASCGGGLPQNGVNLEELTHGVFQINCSTTS